MLIKQNIAKTEQAVAKSVEVVAKAGSKQAGQLDEKGAKAESTMVRKNTFDGAISTVALAKAGRRTE